MSHFSSLPDELIWVICDHLDLQAQICLSCTNSVYRTVLAPRVFRIIKVTNREPDTENQRALAKKYSQHVQGLRFVGSHDPATDESTEIGGKALDQVSRVGNDNESCTLSQKWLGKRVLPEATEELLRGHHTPNVVQISIYFDFDLDSEPLRWDDRGFRSLGVDRDREDDDSMKHEEGRYKWRALMTTIWSTITVNRNVNKLVMDRLIPRRTSAFCSPEFRDFLGQVDDLDVSFREGSMGSQFLGFLPDFHELFYAHTPSLRRLRLATSKNPGCTYIGYWQVPLPLNMGYENRFRSLRQVVLERSIINEELILFLSQRLETLENLELRNCRASLPGTYSLVDGGIPWSRLFETIRAICRLALTKLILVCDTVYFSFDEEWNSGLGREGPDREPEEFGNIRTLLREDPQRWRFPYASCDEDITITDYEQNILAFKADDDSREYGALVEAMKAKGGTVHYSSPDFVDGSFSQ